MSVYFSISKFIFLSNSCGRGDFEKLEGRGGAVFCIRQSAPGPGKASALPWPTLSRRRVWASEHLFVSGCEIVSQGEFYITGELVTPVKCDTSDKRQTGVTAPASSRQSPQSSLSQGLSFFLSDRVAKVCGKQTEYKSLIPL